MHGLALRDYHSSLHAGAHVICMQPERSLSSTKPRPAPHTTSIFDCSAWHLLPHCMRAMHRCIRSIIMLSFILFSGPYYDYAGEYMCTHAIQYTHPAADSNPIPPVRFYAVVVEAGRGMLPPATPPSIDWHGCQEMKSHTRAYA